MGFLGDAQERGSKEYVLWTRFCSYQPMAEQSGKNESVKGMGGKTKGEEETMHVRIHGVQDRRPLLLENFPGTES
jgi:hypothetical protein